MQFYGLLAHLAVIVNTIASCLLPIAYFNCLISLQISF